MNTRQFLQTIPFLGVALFAKNKPKSEYILKEIIPPINKRVCFTEGKFDFEIMVTDNLIIPSKDGSFDINAYGELCKMIGRVSPTKKNIGFDHPDFKIGRAEGNLILKKDFEKSYLAEFVFVLSILRKIAQ